MGNAARYQPAAADDSAEQAGVAAMCRRIALAALAFAHALRHQLRDSDPTDDLPLEALSYGIEIPVHEVIGDTELPGMPEPVAYCLQ